MESFTNWWNANQSLVIHYAIQLLIAIIIFVIGKMIAKAVTKLFTKALNAKKVDKAVSSFLSSIVYSLLIVAVVLMALGQLGIETTSFVAILGAAGLAIGLALKDSLANFASGVLIILLKPFKAGDYVEAAGIAGAVEKIEIFSSIIKTPDNKVIIVPNAAITAGPITNYSKEATRRVDLVIGVGYDADLKQAKQVITDVVTGNSRVLQSPAPTIAVSELADSSVNFVVRPWVNTPEYWDAYFELTEAIKFALDDANINIPFPQMDVHFNKSE